MYLPWEKPAPSIPPARVIAEIGGNHMGSLDIAKEMVRHAKLCGAYAVKFQKRCVRELLSEEEFHGFLERARRGIAGLVKRIRAGEIVTRPADAGACGPGDCPAADVCRYDRWLGGKERGE